uniref:Uncharacterized protein n=1 Tax=Anguilla anguilla TaxID=7936 RepID=A0A0E9WZ49_ANGAN
MTVHFPDLIHLLCVKWGLGSCGSWGEWRWQKQGDLIGGLVFLKVCPAWRSAVWRNCGQNSEKIPKQSQTAALHIQTPAPVQVKVSM